MNTPWTDQNVPKTNQNPQWTHPEPIRSYHEPRPAYNTCIISRPCMNQEWCENIFLWFGIIVTKVPYLRKGQKNDGLEIGNSEEEKDAFFFHDNFAVILILRFFWFLYFNFIYLFIANFHFQLFFSRKRHIFGVSKNGQKMDKKWTPPFRPLQNTPLDLLF